jgi:hypothetical protein
MRKLSIKDNLPAQTVAIRTGVMISLGGVMVAACTVNLWGPIYAWLMFFAGSLLWILEDNKDTFEERFESEPEASGMTYSRFARNTHRRDV